MFASTSGPCLESKPRASFCNAENASPIWAAYSPAPGTPPEAVSYTPDLGLLALPESPASSFEADIPYGQPFESSSLISPQSSSRPHRRLPLSPVEALPLSPLPATALFPYQNHNTYPRRQHAAPFLVNVLPSSDNSGPSNQHGSSRTSPLESYSLSSSTPSQHVSINSSLNRPRTPYPVFSTTSALAAHHGIPQSLPPVPRTTRYSQSSPSPESVSASATTSEPDFTVLCSDYLTMLSQNPEGRESAASRAVMPGREMSEQDVAVSALLDVLQASPEFQMGHDFGEFLTSPMDDSPFDEFLTTPAVGGSDLDFDLLTSPAIVDDGDDFDIGSGSLFGGDAGLGLNVAALTAFKNATTASSAPSASVSPLLNLDAMYTMPSPTTPALDPSSLHPSPQVQSLPPSSALAPGRRKNGPTGTRKNIMPESLVPLDAPIQSRKYLTPSATSRKEVPAVFAKKKRSMSQAFAEDEDVLLAPSDMDAIEAKRRQNTLAARRSRKRKLEYQRELEISVEQEREEKEMWKARAQICEALLHSHGLDVPKFEQ